MEKLTSSAPPTPDEGKGGWEAGDRSESGTARSQATNRAISYFPLCRLLGARAVDGLVRGRILELRWTDTVSPEGDPKVMKLKGGKRRGHAEEVTGPVLLPTTPVMRHAMGVVLDELRAEAAARDKQQQDKDRGGQGESGKESGKTKK